ncbi:hypothetical protein HKX48_001611 [Thoreauomyces humboldtii]|nr:hypothetical protein HKX48_001611 [Thoreauomyces humboldtii]
MIPRVSGSAANIRVREHIVQVFEGLGWHVETDAFNASTPHGSIAMANVIVTKDITAPRKLLLAAHFDSKYFDPPLEFVGATDSAVPCAILVDVATTLNPYMASQRSDTSLQMVFFDGEEAFVQWSGTDSLYGSRHLAARWEAEYVMPTVQPGPWAPAAETQARNILSSIDVMILLDLLGSKRNPQGAPVQIYNSHPDTSQHWNRLVDIQLSLAERSALSPFLVSTLSDLSAGGDGDGGYFMSSTTAWQTHQGIEDDHIPFKQRGVPIVHVIPAEFPSVWHKIEDNADAVDPDIVHDFALIFRVFVAEYLDLVIPNKT